VRTGRGVSRGKSTLDKVGDIAKKLEEAKNDFCKKHPKFCRMVDRFKEPVAYGLTLWYIKAQMHNTVADVDRKFEEFKKYNQIELDYLKGKISKREMEELEKEAPDELKLVKARIIERDKNGRVVDEKVKEVRAYLSDLFPDKYKRLE
jgi:translation elongation factor EF-1beta